MEMIKAEPKEVGRPGKYETNVLPRLEEIEEWIREGITDYCIADNLNIGYSTLMAYKDRYLELQEVYTRAQRKQVQKVVNAVMKRATGYDYTETVEEDGVIKKSVTKHIPGDVNAQKFYLINKDSENWRPENRVETVNTIINVSLEELYARRQELLEELKQLNVIEINGGIEDER